MSEAPNGRLVSGLFSAATQGEREPTTDKTRVVSTRRRVPTNWVSGRTPQPSIEQVVAYSDVPSDFLVEGHGSGLGLCSPYQFKLLKHMDYSSSSCVRLPPLLFFFKALRRWSYG